MVTKAKQEKVVSPMRMKGVLSMPRQLLGASMTALCGLLAANWNDVLNQASHLQGRPVEYLAKGCRHESDEILLASAGIDRARLMNVRWRWPERIVVDRKAGDQARRRELSEAEVREKATQPCRYFADKRPSFIVKGGFGRIGKVSLEAREEGCQNPCLVGRESVRGHPIVGMCFYEFRGLFVTESSFWHPITFSNLH